MTEKCLSPAGPDQRGPSCAADRAQAQAGAAGRQRGGDGSLHIWAPTSRFDDPARFVRDLTKLGFKAFPPRERGSFTYIEASKTRRGPVEGALVRFREKGEE